MIMALLAAVTGLIKGKQKEKTPMDTLSAIDSPVVEKIYNYNVKISNLDRDTEEKRSQLTDLRQKYANAHKEYFNSDFDEKVLKESVKIKDEIAELETIVQQMEKAKMRDLSGRAMTPKLKLTDEDKQSLIDGYAPLKAKREELFKQVLEQSAALEKTLDQLKAEQIKVNEVFSQFYYHIGKGTDEDIWAITVLDAFKGGEIDLKMQQVANKHQFTFQWPMFY